MSAPNKDQFDFWEEVTPGWLASEGHTELVSGAFGAAGVQRIDLSAGQRVLDIGCGSGSTTLALAAAVGPSGTAVGVDIAPAMVEAARRAAAAAGVTNATFVA